jgi:NADH-quinone oxidoreductase subunit N
MPGNYMPSAVELFRFAPEMLLTVAGTLLMILEAITSPDRKRFLPVFAFLSLIAAAALAVAGSGDAGPAFNNMLLVDGFATYFRVLVFAIGAVSILLATNYLKEAEHTGGEYYALVLFSVVGQCLMATANELIMIFIGIEVSSIATYVLAGYLRDDKRNNESALKYFLLGSFATAFLLYGVAWIYGTTGTTNLNEIRALLLDPQHAPNALLLSAAVGLIFVGLLFKVAAVPFQSWAPDVYQGAAAPVTAFMSVGPKAAAFAAFLRIAMWGFEPAKGHWGPVLYGVAIATMVVGNFAALRQVNVKRLLAYSSIAHAGYVLVALTAASKTGTEAAMFYMASYAAMNLGAFAVITHVARKGERYVEIADFAGLGNRQPLTAALFTVFLLSLIGVPLTGGFFAKFYVFKSALDSHLIALTVIGLLNSAVAAFYYLRLIVTMYMQPAPEGVDTLPEPSIGIRTALVVCSVATVVLGVFPSLVLDIASRGASFIR